nr:HTH domain-containing protein [Clostridium chromiireducens]
MGKSRNRDFTDAEISILAQNRNIKKISSRQITYQDCFKKLFIDEHNAGKLPRDIFIENGFDPEMIGQNRIDRCSVRWRSKANRPEGVRDIRKGNSGRIKVSKIEMSTEEELMQLKQQNEYLKQENSFLRELQRIERQVMSRLKLNQEKNTK